MPDNVLNLFRMEADPVNGLRPEPVTHTEYEEAVYQYCVARLGSLFRRDDWCRVSVILPDLNATLVHRLYDDDEALAGVKLRAIVATEAKYDFPDFCWTQDGFDYPPYGPGASSFGFYCPTTIAWIFPHRDGPALLFKATSDENVNAVSKFMEFAARALPRPWPEKPKEKTLIVPEAMARFSTRPGMLRQSRAKARLSRLRSRR